jgi:hypothetical protein
MRRKRLKGKVAYKHTQNQNTQSHAHKLLISAYLSYAVVAAVSYTQHTTQNRRYTHTQTSQNIKKKINDLPALTFRMRQLLLSAQYSTLRNDKDTSKHTQKAQYNENRLITYQRLLFVCGGCHYQLHTAYSATTAPPAIERHRL